MIDFGSPLSSAGNRTGSALFRTFDIGKWFMLGVSAWLASFLRGAGVPQNFNSIGNSSNSGTEVFEKLYAWGLPVWLAIVIGVGLFMAALTLLFVWLGARGQFMFLDNVVRGRADILVPWRNFRGPANDVWRVYAVFHLGCFFLVLALFTWALIYVWPDLGAWKLRPIGEYAPLLVGAVVVVALWAPLTIVLFFFREFGVPIMYLSGCSAWQAGRRVADLATHRTLDFLVFLIVMILMGLVFMLVRGLVGCLTCCVGFFPYLSTVFTLPLPVFQQCYVLDCLSQFGPEYDVWRKAGEPPPLA